MDIWRIIRTKKGEAARKTAVQCKGQSQQEVKQDNRRKE
jgi:hypothetical protein